MADNADDQVYCMQTESVFVGAKYTTLYDEDRKYQLEKKAKQIVPAPFKRSHPPCVSPHLTPQAHMLVDSLSRSAESGPSLIAFHAKVIEIADLEDLFHL